MKLNISQYKQEITINAFSIVWVQTSRHILPGSWFDKTPDPYGFHVFVYGEGPGYYVYHDDDPYEIYDNEHAHYSKVDYTAEEVELSGLSERIRDLIEHESLDFPIKAIVEHTHRHYSFKKELIDQTSFQVDFDDAYIPKAFEATLGYAKEQGKDELSQALGRYMKLDPDHIF